MITFLFLFVCIVFLFVFTHRMGQFFTYLTNRHVMFVMVLS